MRGLRRKRAKATADETPSDVGPAETIDEEGSDDGNLAHGTEAPAAVAQGAVVRPQVMDEGMKLVLAGSIMLAPEGCPVGSCVHCGEPATSTGDGFRFRHSHLTHLAPVQVPAGTVRVDPADAGARRFEVVQGSQYCDPHNLASQSMKSGKDIRDPQIVGFDRGSSVAPTSPGLRWVKGLLIGDVVVWGNRVEAIVEIELVLGSLRLCFASGKVAEFAVDAHDVIYRIPDPGEVSTWDHQWHDNATWEPPPPPVAASRDAWTGGRFLGAYLAKTILHKGVYSDDLDALKRLVATEDHGLIHDLSGMVVLHWSW